MPQLRRARHEAQPGGEGGGRGCTGPRCRSPRAARGSASAPWYERKAGGSTNRPGAGGDALPAHRSCWSKAHRRRPSPRRGSRSDEVHTAVEAGLVVRVGVEPLLSAGRRLVGSLRGGCVGEAGEGEQHGRCDTARTIHALETIFTCSGYGPYGWSARHRFRPRDAFSEPGQRPASTAPVRHRPSRRSSTPPAANAIRSKTAPHPSPVGDCTRKPTRAAARSFSVPRVKTRTKVQVSPSAEAWKA
ncbi:hypothetical protein SMICM304S_11612 [Streptomyces microflavus]